MAKSFLLKRNFIERSILSALSFLKETTLFQENAERKGLLQSIDPRIKMITFLMLLVTVVSVKTTSLISMIYLLCLLLALFSRIGLGFFLLRTWVFIPLFSLCIVIPALFHFVTPGEAVYQFSLFGMEFVVTRPGLEGAILFVTRIATSVSLAVLLSLTTRHTELLQAVRLFGVPSIFILTTSMCYRYLTLFAVMIENTFAAIKSRVGVVVRRKQGQKIVAWNVANTWGHANQMNEEVYRAMLSRGYTGEARSMKHFKAGPGDWVWFLGSAVFCAGILYLGHKT